MGLETIIGLAALVMAAIAGAFGIGHSTATAAKRKRKLTSSAPKKRPQPLKRWPNAG